MTDKRQCRHCGSDLPPEHVGRGRQKQFCNDVCRVMKGYRNRNGVTTNRQRLERHLGFAYVAPKMSEPEKAWLAAMVDGEGCILLGKYVKKKSPGQRWYIFPSVSVCNSNPALINRVVEIVGKPYTRVQAHKRDLARRKQMYAVFVTRVAMTDVLEQIKPYLVAKGKQADLVLEFCRMHDQIPCKTAPLERFAEMWAEARALNKRGVA